MLFFKKKVVYILLVIEDKIISLKEILLLEFLFYMVRGKFIIYVLFWLVDMFGVYFDSFFSLGVF